MVSPEGRVVAERCRGSEPGRTEGIARPARTRLNVVGRKRNRRQAGRHRRNLTSRSQQLLPFTSSIGILTGQGNPFQIGGLVMKISIRKRSIRVLVIAAVVVAVGSVSVAMARPGPSMIAVEAPSTADDPIPPPAPPEKAAAAAEAQDLPRDSTAPADEHTHDEDGEPPNGPSLVDWMNDPDVWVCIGPDDLGHSRIIHAPSESMLLAARDAVMAERAKDPGYMPTVEYAAAPEGCQPIDGKSTLEDFYRARSSAAVINADGSVKSEAEIAADAEARP